MKPMEEYGTMQARAVMPARQITFLKPSSAAIFSGVAERWAACIKFLMFAYSVPLTTRQLSVASNHVAAVARLS